MESNNLNNLPPFFIGQKVVYITGISMPKDSVHTVKFTNKSSCGCWFISIGEDRIDSDDGSLYYCVECGNNVVGNFINGWSAKSFRPLQESVFPSLIMSKAIEKESQLVSMN